MGSCGLSCRWEWQRIEVHLIGCLAVKRGMRTALVVEAEIAFQALPCLGDGVVGMQVDLLVLDAFLEPFDEHVVDPATLPIHALLDAVGP